MRTWNVMTAERRATWCSVALDLRDEFTGSGVFGRVVLHLDVRDGASWLPTDLTPIRNSGGIFLYTGLGRFVDPIGQPSFRVRVRIEADYYRPAFQATDDAIELDVFTFNDTTPPAAPPVAPEIVLMLPGAAYPFGGHVRKILGRVIDPAGDPLADATVQADGVERSITGPNGGFTLPLRWQSTTANVNVVVDHPRTGRGAVQVFSLPGDLVGNHDITVT